MYLKTIILGGLVAIPDVARASSAGSIELRAKQPCYDSAPGHLCAAHGTLQDPVPLKFVANNDGNASGPAKGVVGCRALCIQFLSLCKSFAFYPETGFCQLFRKTLADQTFVKGTSPKQQVYYDKTCFDCLDRCPRPPEQNLLVNGGFDAFPNDISPWISLIDYQLHKPGHVSKQAFGFKRPIKYNSYIGQKFHACRRDYYVVAFDFKSIQPDPPKYPAGLTMQLGNGLEYRTKIYPGQTGWISAAMITTQLEGLQELVLKPGPAKQMYIDNVRVQRLSHPRVRPHTPNLLSNPGFESGKKGYKLSEGCRVVSTGHHSPHSVHCNDHGGSTVTPVVSLRKYTGYFMSFDYKVVAPKGEFCFIRALIGQHWKKQMRVKYNTWDTHRFVVYLIAAPLEFSLLLDGEHGARNCDFYLDNLVLKEADFNT